MDIYTVIAHVRTNPPRTQSAAEMLLNGLTQDLQEQLIAAVYAGRSHINMKKLDSSIDVTRRATDHIDAANYAQILYEKSSSLDTYLGTLVECARASDFDLKTI